MPKKSNGEKLISLGTYLTNNKLSRSKDLIEEFEEKVEPDNLKTTVTKQYKVSTIEKGIEKLGMKFKRVQPRKGPVKNTYISKYGRDYSMSVAEIAPEKCVKTFQGEDVFKKTRDFLGINIDIDKNNVVLEFDEPLFRSMMKFLVG